MPVYKNNISTFTFYQKTDSKTTPWGVKVVVFLSVMINYDDMLFYFYSVNVAGDSTQAVIA